MVAWFTLKSTTPRPCPSRKSFCKHHCLGTSFLGELMISTNIGVTPQPDLPPKAPQTRIESETSKFWETLTLKKKWRQNSPNPRNWVVFCFCGVFSFLSIIIICGTQIWRKLVELVYANRTRGNFQVYRIWLSYTNACNCFIFLQFNLLSSRFRGQFFFN